MPSTRLQFSKNLNHKSYTIFFMRTWFVRLFLAAASYRRLTFYNITVVCFHFRSPHALLRVAEHFPLVLFCKSYVAAKTKSTKPLNQPACYEKRASKQKNRNENSKINILAFKNRLFRWCFDRFIIRPLFHMHVSTQC